MPPALKGPARIRGLRLAIAGASLAFVIGFGGYRLARPPVPAHPPSAATLPDMRLEEFDLLMIDPSGRIFRRLSVREARRDHPDAAYVLAEPRLRVFSRTGATWFLAAENGEVYPDGETIYLAGQVTGRRGAASPLEIDTRDVRIMPMSDYAESAAPTTIRGAAFEVRGEGAKIWLDEGRIDLLNEARGTLQSP